MPSRLQDALLGAAAGAGGSSLAFLVLLKLYLQRELKPARLIHGTSEDHLLEQERLLSEVKLLLRDYWPHPLLEFSGYTSTFWSGFWASLHSKVAEGPMEVLTLRDGGTVSLHWCGKREEDDRRRIILILPGLNNDSTTTFIQGTMKHLRSEGFSTVALNYRGCCGLELTSPRFGCADSWNDFDEVVDHIDATNKGASILGLGFSMGAGLLMRYLGEKGSAAKLRGAVAVAAPLNFPLVAQYLESNVRKRWINFLMAQGVKAFMMGTFYKSKYTDKLNRWDIVKATSLRRLEEASICKLHGYKDAEDYYTQNSPMKVLARVTVPTLIVHAEDDPVVSVSTIPLGLVQSNPRLFVAITKRGGHIGWGSGGLGAGAWTDCMARRFLDACVPRSRL
mmetsp:Transcript_58716/g.108312  ORF Transcript_58716/g.108312 Transcript_58716/m.108312 type:complete len:393 (-) Transcript_58716:60-1238(-)